MWIEVVRSMSRPSPGSTSGVASRPTILSFNDDATRARLAIVVSRVALWIRTKMVEFSTIG
jgi:hypothetical protein